MFPSAALEEGSEKDLTFTDDWKTNTIMFCNVPNIYILFMLVAVSYVGTSQYKNDGFPIIKHTSMTLEDG